MVRNTLYLVVLCIMACACGEGGTRDEVVGIDFEWLEGEFVYHTGRGSYKETWERRGDAEYNGSGYFLYNNDTAFSMRMKLYRENGIMKMDYNVRGQNQGKDVHFALTKQEHDIYVFENPFRGFPSIMQYRLLGDTAVEVTERGFENNKDKVQEFRLRKVSRRN